MLLLMQSIGKQTSFSKWLLSKLSIFTINHYVKNTQSIAAISSEEKSFKISKLFRFYQNKEHLTKFDMQRLYARFIIFPIVLRSENSKYC